MNSTMGKHQQVPGSVATGIRKVMIVTALLLLVPLIAMQLTAEVNWTFSDFVLAAVMIGGTGSLYVFAASKVKTSRQRVIIGCVLGFAFLTIWAELAVGIFV